MYKNIKNYDYANSARDTMAFNLRTPMTISGLQSAKL